MWAIRSTDMPLLTELDMLQRSKMSVARNATIIQTKLRRSAMSSPARGAKSVAGGMSLPFRHSTSKTGHSLPIILPTHSFNLFLR